MPSNLKESTFTLDASLYRDFELCKLDTLVVEYHKALHRYPVFTGALPGSVIEAIRLVKRNTGMQIGPYKQITVFEALNRIATDLVAIHGLHELAVRFPKDARVNICMGNQNHKGMEGDIMLEFGGQVVNVEVFNCSPSFFSSKLGRTLEKWKDRADGRKLDLIFFNSDLNERALRLKKRDYDRPELIGVVGWDQYRLSDEIIRQLQNESL